MNYFKHLKFWIMLILTISFASGVLLITPVAENVLSFHRKATAQPGNWEEAYGMQYPHIDDYEELASRGITLVVNNVRRTEAEWEQYYSAAVANNLEIIAVLWGVDQTAWSWNATANEWELDINTYPDSTGAQFLQFLRDNPTYLAHTFAIYSFHEPYNPDSPAQISASRMRKFWRQIHEEEFPNGELKIYGESVSWKSECANGCVDYDALSLYNFAYCGLGVEYQYRPLNATPDPGGLSIQFGRCSTDKNAVIEAGKELIEDYYNLAQSSPPAPDGSRTKHFALVQTFAKNYTGSGMGVVNRMPAAWEMYEWGTQIVNAKRDKLAGMQWYVFRFGDLYDFKLGDNRYDAECADRWQTINAAAAVLLDDQQPLPPRPTPTPSGPSWEAEDGSIVPPFVVENGYVYQPSFTGDDLLSAGKATYQFTIDEPENYIVKAAIDAPDQHTNSLYVSMDAEPDLTMVWDVDITIGFEERVVSWGSESSPRVFPLSTGEHELIIRGRDADAKIDRISLVKLWRAQPVAKCLFYLPAIYRN